MISPAVSGGGRIAPVVAIVSTPTRTRSTGSRARPASRPRCRRRAARRARRPGAPAGGRRRGACAMARRLRSGRAGVERGGRGGRRARPAADRRSVPRPARTRRWSSWTRAGTRPSGWSAAAGRSASRAGRWPSPGCGASSGRCRSCAAAAAADPRAGVRRASRRGGSRGRGSAARSPGPRAARAHGGVPRALGRPLGSSCARCTPTPATACRRTRSAGPTWPSGCAMARERLAAGLWRAPAPDALFAAALALPARRGDVADARRPAPAPPARRRRAARGGVIDWGDVCRADPAIDMAL